MNKRLSVCIPTYNRKELLKEALNSVFRQTYQPDEIIVLDDGSTDETEQMIKNSGWDVRYYYQANSGDASARNRLIEYAEGDYISFLDSDDLLVDDALERLIETAEREQDEVIVYGPYLRIDADGRVCGKCKRKIYSGWITTQLFKTILVHSCGSLFPRKILVEAGGFDTDLNVCSDYKLWLDLSLKYEFAGLKKPVFKRRRHQGNLSSEKYKNVLTELRVLENFYYHRGGKKSVCTFTAMRRLSRLATKAGRLAIREGRTEEARKTLLTYSFKYPNLKNLFYLLKCRTIAK